MTIVCFVRPAEPNYAKEGAKWKGSQIISMRKQKLMITIC